MRAQTSNAHRSAAWGLWVRKERWSFSWKGWLLLLFLSIGIGSLIIWNVHPFLALTRRLNTDVLVVEGWIPRSSIQAAAVEFTSGKYRRVFTAGGPVHGSSPEKNPYSTSASIGAGQLRQAGVPAAAVQMVPSFIKDRDRTYSAALALRHWFEEHEPQVTRLNVFTEGVHARRSQLLFQKALGDKFEVGIISVSNTDYDATHWWRYSEGVKEIVSEGAAYFYVLFFFYPDN